MREGAHRIDGPVSPLPLLAHRPVVADVGISHDVKWQTGKWVSFEYCIRALVDTMAEQAGAEQAGAKARADQAASEYLLAVHERLPDYLRMAFRILILLFDAWAYASAAQPFHCLDHERRARQVAAWERSRLAFRRDLMGFHRAIAAFALHSEHLDAAQAREGDNDRC